MRPEPLTVQLYGPSVCFEFGGTEIATLPVSNHSEARSEEHTSELQSLRHLVCRLLLEKKKLTSSGPILYRQERMGLDGRRFKILKFRTMIKNAEHTTGPVWATPDDYRVTSLGRILRATSLYELPQLINVLSGEMSLVGPRPERPVLINYFRKSIPGYMLFHLMKPRLPRSTLFPYTTLYR